MKDYYQALGVDRDATPDEIKNAFRRLARETHPDANPNDPIHYGSGKVAVYQDAVFLEPDFEVGPGPRFHVYLVPLDAVTPDTAVDETAFVDLGRLRAFKGSQLYPIPAGVDPVDYGSVVIWCVQFGVLVSPARLLPVPDA